MNLNYNNVGVAPLGDPEYINIDLVFLIGNGLPKAAAPTTFAIRESTNLNLFVVY